MDVRIQKAKINNFRSIREITISFAPEITLLVGPNGGGKTNILKALAIYFKKYQISELDKNPHFQGSFTIQCEGIDKRSVISDEILRTHSFYMEAIRVYEAYSPIIMRLDHLSSNGENLAGALDYYKSSITQASDFELFIKRIKRMIPEVENVNATIVEPDSKKSPGNLARLNIQIKKDNKTVIVNAENATSGTLDAIFLAFILQILPEGSVYLLDSPDSHLHAGAQIAMIELLREVAKNEKKQFIIATHSPTLVGMCSPEEVILVTKKGLETTVNRVSELTEVLNVLDNSDATLSDIVNSMKP